jgi:hypothetical protein
MRIGLGGNPLRSKLIKGAAIIRELGVIRGSSDFNLSLQCQPPFYSLTAVQFTFK